VGSAGGTYPRQNPPPSWNQVEGSALGNTGMIAGTDCWSSDGVPGVCNLLVSVSEQVGVEAGVLGLLVGAGPWDCGGWSLGLGLRMGRADGLGLNERCGGEGVGVGEMVWDGGVFGVRVQRCS